MYVNKVFVLGNLTRDPESKQLPSNVLVTNLGIATNRVYKNQQGEKVEEVEYHNIVLFGRIAEIAQQYLRKGSSAYIEGRLRTNSWEADGVKKYKTEIIAESLQLGPKRDGAGKGDGGGGAKQDGSAEKDGAPQYPESTIKPEDIPF